MDNKYILIIETKINGDRERQLVYMLQQKIPDKEIRILSINSGNDLQNNISYGKECDKSLAQISSIVEIESLILNAYLIIGSQTPIIEEIVSYFAGRLRLQTFNKCNDFKHNNDELRVGIYKNICGGCVEAEVVVLLHERPIFITLNNTGGNNNLSNTDDIPHFSVNYELLYDQKVKFVSENKANLNTLELNDAKIVIAGGRGIADRKDFELLESLAISLNGSVGASRAAVDKGFASDEQQVECVVGIQKVESTKQLYLLGFWTIFSSLEMAMILGIKCRLAS